MADLPAAIANAREAARRAKEAPSIYAGDRCHHALDDLLAALDAAQPVGVIWRPDPTKPLGVSWRGPMIHTLPHETPLYLSPQAPPASVPVLQDLSDRFSAMHAQGDVWITSIAAAKMVQAAMLVSAKGEK